MQSERQSAELVKAALAAIRPEAGYELLKVRLVTEPDGVEKVRLLLDYGIGGVKVFEALKAGLILEQEKLAAKLPAAILPKVKKEPEQSGQQAQAAEEKEAKPAASKSPGAKRTASSRR